MAYTANLRRTFSFRGVPMRNTHAALCTLVGGLIAAAVPTTAAAQNPWQMYEFSGTESFEYDVWHSKDGQEQTGFFNLSIATNGGQMTGTVSASLGDASCSATTPMSTPQAIMPQMLMMCMAVAPVAMVMFAPTWMMFMGQSWQLGSTMNMSQGDDQMSFSVTEECSYAGVAGLLGVMQSNDFDAETCVATEVALPLYVSWNNKDDDQLA